MKTPKTSVESNYALSAQINSSRARGRVRLQHKCGFPNRTRWAAQPFGDTQMAAGGALEAGPLWEIMKLIQRKADNKLKAGIFFFFFNASLGAILCQALLLPIMVSQQLFLDRLGRANMSPTVAHCMEYFCKNCYSTSVSPAEA